MVVAHLKLFLLKPKRQKWLFALSLILIISTVGYAINLFISERALNFQIYQPHTVPAGITIKGYDISINRGESKTAKYIVYSTNTNDFYISEQKSSPDQYAMNSYDCTTRLTNAKCTKYISPGHQKYSIETVYTDNLSGKPFSETISWLRGSTLIWITLDHGQIQKYTPKIWDKVVDSFTPIDYPHARIQRTRWNGV